MLSNIVEVIKLNKYYSLGKEKFHALKDVNLEIEQGDFVMIMGKSGSGKTTLMNLLGLLDSFEDGTYKFNNIDVSKLKEDQKADIRNKYMGFIFQQFHLINSMTIGSNVELPLLYNEKSIPRKKGEELIDSNTSTEIMEILKKLNEDNKTIIMVTHDEDLTKYANKIIRVKDGVITKGEDYVSN